MPKKIVIKFKEEDRKDESFESIPHTGPEASTTITLPENREALVSEVSEVRSFDDVMKDYESIMSKIQDIKLREQIFQKMFMEQDISIPTVKKILSKWNEMRDELIKECEPLKEKLEALKSKLEADFSRIEADLYMSIVELDAIKHKEGQNIPVSQKEITDLETRITVLRQELSEKKKNIKELESKIKELTDLPKKIYALTSYTEIANKLYQELKERYGARFGPKPDEALQKSIEMMMQNEGIPREYAIILIWKRLSSSPPS